MDSKVSFFKANTFETKIRVVPNINVDHIMAVMEKISYNS